METTLKERLTLAMAGPPKVTQAALARACNVRPPSVTDWLSGRTHTLAGPNLLKASRFLGVSPDWLSEGKGLMRPPDAKTARYRIAEGDATTEAVAIDLSNERGSCGGGSIDWSEDKREPLYKEAGWFRHYKVKPKDVLAVWADGDSMAPYITDGDLVFFDTSKTIPRTGSIFLVKHPDGQRIKRLRRKIDGAWVLESLSDNKNSFPDEEITTDHAELLVVRGQFLCRQG